jgi:hypothetical protein
MHHGIFILHIATSYFMTLFAFELVDLLHLSFDISFLGKLGGWLIIAWLIYYFVAFKRFYQLRLAKGLGYFVLVLLMQQILVAFIFMGLLIFSFFSL